jgi:hypothetical protein
VGVVPESLDDFAAVVGEGGDAAAERVKKRLVRDGISLRALFAEGAEGEKKARTSKEGHSLILTLHVSAGSSVHAWIQKNPSEAMNASASSSGMITGPKSPGAPQASRRHHST